MDNPVFSSPAWRAQVPTLLTIAADGSFPQRRLAVTLLARELAGRWWSSVWDVSNDYFAFLDLRITCEHGPEVILAAQYLGRGGADVARYYEVYGAEGGCPFPTGYIRRGDEELLDDGTYRRWPLVAGPPGQVEITNDCTTRAAGLIAEWGAP